MQKLRIAVDMDEVIADMHGAKLAWLTERFGYEWKEHLLVGKNVRDLIDPAHAAALDEHLHLGEFFGDLQIIDGSVEALRELNARHDLFITTAAMEFPLSLRHKWDWLRRNMPFLDPLNIVFCGRKDIVCADFLIDDSPRHFERFIGQGILFSAPHNALETRYPRLASWNDAAHVLTELSSRRQS